MNKGILYTLASSVVWGTLPLFWRALDDTAPLYILSSRIVWSFVFTGLLVLLLGKRGDYRAALQNKRLLLRTCLAGLMISFNWLIYITAVNSGHALDATMGQFMNTLACSLAAFLVFHERPNKGQAAAIALASCGVLIMVVQYGKVPWVALLISGTFGLYSTFKKSLALDAIVALNIESLAALPAALPAVLWLEATGGGALAQLSGWRLALVPALGIITAVPLLLYSKGVRMISLSLAGFMQYISSFLSLLIALFVFHEPFTVPHAVGYAFLWLSLPVFFLASRRTGQTQSGTKQTPQ